MKECGKLTFKECELFILRQSMDKIEKFIKKKKINSPEINKIFKIVEIFIEKRKVICYGGTAINNILPKKEQFYDRNIDLPHSFINYIYIYIIIIILYNIIKKNYN